MSKKILSLVVIMMVSTLGFSQVEVKINPISALFGQISVSAEYIVKENIGAEATLGYYFKADESFGETSKSSGIVTNFLFKYYFSPSEAGGDKFYVFPYARYAKRTWTFNDANTNSEIEGSITSIGVGFGAGYKIVAESGLLFDFGLGVGKNFGGTTTYSDSNYSEIEEITFPINVLGRISIGYRF